MEKKFLPKPNDQGFIVNITHPDIEPKYHAFKSRRGIARSSPMSMDERRAFERDIMNEEREFLFKWKAERGLGPMDKMPEAVKTEWERVRKVRGL